MTRQGAWCATCRAVDPKRNSLSSCFRGWPITSRSITWSLASPTIASPALRARSSCVKRSAATLPAASLEPSPGFLALPHRWPHLLCRAVSPSVLEPRGTQSDLHPFQQPVGTPNPSVLRQKLYHAALPSLFSLACRLRTVTGLHGLRVT